MCTIVAAITALSTVVSAAGAIQQGNAAAAAHNANAQIFEQQAEARRQKAEFDKAQAENNFRRVLGRQRAAAAGSGFSVLSFQDIFDDSKLESGLEKKAIEFTAQHEIANLKTSANAERSKASSARTAGRINAFGAVLSGAGKIASSKRSITLSTAFTPLK